MQDDRGAGLEAARDLPVALVALTELHGLTTHASLLDDEHGPAFALAEETSDRDLEHAVVLPQDDADLNAIAITETRRFAGIREIDDDVDALLLDAERRDLHEAGGLDASHASVQCVAAAPLFDEDFGARLNANRVC